MNLDRMIVALSLIGLAGCAGLDLVDYAAENDTKFYSAPLSVESGRAIVNVIWVPQSRMHEYCPRALACAVPVGNEWWVYTEKPHSWNDSIRLKRLGHEVAHALSARHE